jgi:hypothetical protein
MVEQRIEFLEEAGRILTEALQDEIINEGLLDTGALARSPRFKVQLINGNPELLVFMDDYGFYQDSGVKGVGQNRVTPNGESFYPPGQFKSEVIGGPLPFPVRFSIAQKGLKPRPFITKAYNRAIQWMNENIIENEEDMIDNNISKIFSTNGAIVS